MDKEVRVAYCTAREVVCSLGKNIEETYSAMENYECSMSRFDDGTPLCQIDKSKLDIEGLGDYTFAEQLVILALESIFEQSKIDLNSDKIALIISTTKGNISTINSDFERSYLWAMCDKIGSHFGYKGEIIMIVIDAGHGG